MSWTITPSQALPDDADAVAYIAAVEAADGEALEPAVRLAINSFIKGCKADGIWPSIKASCILAGARTLNGALVPLVGAAPTNYNFVAGDYDRKTGLVGDGSTKYLDSNRNNNADPQNSKHLAVYPTAGTQGTESLIGALASGTRLSQIINNNGALSLTANSSAGYQVAALGSAIGFMGVSRYSDDFINARYSQTSMLAISNAASTPVTNNTVVFARNYNGVVGLHTYARLAFYSIGEALDLALLDTRVTALVNALAAAIP